MECLYECEELDTTCLNCATEGLVDCAVGTCAPEFATIRRCLFECIINVNVLGGSVDRCLEAECGRHYDALTACVDPVIASGDCDADLAACGDGLVD